MRLDTATRERNPLTSWKYDGPLKVGYFPDLHACPDHRSETYKVIRAVANLFKEKEVDLIVHAGDFNDMASLSSWDKGTRTIEGRRLTRDLRFSRDCLQLFNDTLGSAVDTDRIITLGNHEDRLFRMYNQQPQLHDLIGEDPWGYGEYGWDVYDFLSMVEINGVVFSHYFQNPTSVMGSAIGGTIENCLKNLGHSFVQGHTQTLKMGQIHRANGDIHCGTIAGSCYIPDHNYKGPQGNNHWKGALILDNMDDGYYDTRTFGLRSLLKGYYG